jgi:hypothetical protein
MAKSNLQKQDSIRHSFRGGINLALRFLAKEFPMGWMSPKTSIDEVVDLTGVEDILIFSLESTKSCHLIP